jgi:hypothetical protein
MFIRSTINTLSFCLGLLILSSCTQGGFESSDLIQASGDEVNFHSLDVNQYALNKVVCDPMGSDTNPGIYDGLIAELFYLDKSQTHYKKVSKYIEHGHRSDQKLFFSELNVPTRLFNTGFPTQTGGIVKDDEGNKLFEYFALRFKSVLSLSSEDEEGLYELALLSDDGSIMRVTRENGETLTVVDNDGDHPTRMGCGQTLYFERNTIYDVVIDYYQGPRNHIAMIPLWRKVTDGTPSESECGKQGNNRYFDYNNNSQAKQPYLDMLLRGWRPIAAANWGLPYMAQYNPCHQGTVPQISNFNVVDLGNGTALATWATDIPATSQVLVRAPNGDEIMTTSDNILRTNHQVIISDGVQIGIPYQFRGISISEDLGKGMSEEIELSLVMFNL